MFSELYICGESEALSYLDVLQAAYEGLDDEAPFAETDRCTYHNFSHQSIAELLAVLAGGNALELCDEFEDLWSDGGCMIFSLPSQFEKSLSDLDSTKIPELAETCSDEILSANYEVSDYLEMLQELKALALLAAKSNKKMFLLLFF